MLISEVKAKKKIIFPKWANDHEPASTLECRAFHGCEVNIVKQVRGFARGFGAIWKVSASGKISVYIEEELFSAFVKKNAAWAYVHLVDHEVAEARIAIRLAREKYPSKNPYVMVEKDKSLGGEAHVLACKELDGMSELQYMKELDKEADFLEY